MKCRKKPVIVEAFRFQIDEFMPEWFADKVTVNEIITHKEGLAILSRLKVLCVRIKVITLFVG